MPDPTADEQANILLGEAVRLRAQRRYKEGIAKCLDAIKLVPANAEAFEILGDLYNESSLHQAAIEAYRRSIELAPSFPRVEEKLARAALDADKSTRQRQIAQDLLSGRMPVRTRRRSPATVGLMSFLVPGLGQLANQEFGKAVAILVVWMALLGLQFSAAGGIMAQHRGGSGLDLFGTLMAFFIPPALWWTLLQAAVYGYAVIDAAVIASRSGSEDDEGW